MANKVINNLIRRIFSMEDESNPEITMVNNIWPETVMSAVKESTSLESTRTLEDVIKDLREEIRATYKGGTIVFPVRSVNGHAGEVKLNKEDIGLTEVDNTSDMNKPLSDPQKESIMKILENYKFNVNLDFVHEHMANQSNPHKVTLSHINSNGAVTDLINDHISRHNSSTDAKTHVDIRQNIRKLSDHLNEVEDELQLKIDNSLKFMNSHIENPMAHVELFMKKENSNEKVNSFTKLTNSNAHNYPSTRAVVDFVSNEINEFNETLPKVENWIDDIQVINVRDELPTASEKYYRQTYFICIGNGIHPEVAICRLNPDNNSYSWEISDLGSYSKFNPEYFIETNNGLTLNLKNLVNDITSGGENSNVITSASLDKKLDAYYTKTEIDAHRFINDIRILSGEEPGTVRYILSNGYESPDIKVTGVNSLAFKDSVDSNDIKNESINDKHILPQSIKGKHIANNTITSDKLACTYWSILGNTNNPDGDTCQEISIEELAKCMNTLVGNEDPDAWEEGEEYELGNGLYGLRVKETITAGPDEVKRVLLSSYISTKICKLIDAGGSFVYASNPETWSIINGTSSIVLMDETGLYLETVSREDRVDAPCEVWVKYKYK